MKEAAINQPNAMQLRKRQIATIFFFLYFDATVTGSGRGGGEEEEKREVEEVEGAFDQSEWWK